MTFKIVLTEIFCTIEVGPGLVFCLWWSYKIYSSNVCVNLLSNFIKVQNFLTHHGFLGLPEKRSLCLSCLTHPSSLICALTISWEILGCPFQLCRAVRKEGFPYSLITLFSVTRQDFHMLLQHFQLKSDIQNPLISWTDHKPLPGCFWYYGCIPLF